MIKVINRSDIPECVRVIRESFGTVADEFGITPENAPRFTAFATTVERLIHQLDKEHRLMLARLSDRGQIVGYCSLLINEGGECELNNLCVLPSFRHKGIGKELMNDAFERAEKAGCTRMNIGIVEENTVLRKWYEGMGFVHTNTVKFDFFPFTCGYMEKKLGVPLAKNDGNIKEENKMNETNITFRIDEETKAKAEMLFSMLGLDMETALQIFLKRSVAEKGLPFQMNLSNAEKRPEGAAANNGTTTAKEKIGNIQNDIMKSVSDFIDNITK